MYLTAILDAFSICLEVERKQHYKCRLVHQFTGRNYWKYGIPEIFNTNQGSQCTSQEHINILLSNGIQGSMDGNGRAIDNIFVKKLWRTVKYENAYLQAYTDGINLYNGLREYFEFYNNYWFHQSLEYNTPYETYHLKN